MKRRLAVCAAFSPLLLSGCSIAYKLDVLLRHGRVVFLLATDGLGGGKPAPVEDLTVTPVSNGAVPIWEVQSNDASGRSTSEISYGVVPAGMTENRKPVALQTGQVYRVEMLALGGSGSAQFAIMPGSGPEQPIKQLMPRAN